MYIQKLCWILLAWRTRKPKRSFKNLLGTLSFSEHVDHLHKETLKSFLKQVGFSHLSLSLTILVHPIFITEDRNRTLFLTIEQNIFTTAHCRVVAMVFLCLRRLVEDGVLVCSSLCANGYCYGVDSSTLLQQQPWHGVAVGIHCWCTLGRKQCVMVEY